MPFFASHRFRSAAPVLWLLLMALSCDRSDPAQATSPSPGEPGRAAACGEKGLHDCPTQAWMKGNLQAFLLADDKVRLARAFEQLAAAAPAGFDDWSTLARTGATATRAGDLDAVKHSCSECHQRHRERFRREARSQPLF